MHCIITESDPLFFLPRGRGYGYPEPDMVGELIGIENRLLLLVIQEEI